MCFSRSKKDLGASREAGDHEMQPPKFVESTSPTSARLVSTPSGVRPTTTDHNNQRSVSVSPNRPTVQRHASDVSSQDSIAISRSSSVSSFRPLEHHPGYYNATNGTYDRLSWASSDDDKVIDTPTLDATGNERASDISGPGPAYIEALPAIPESSNNINTKAPVSINSTSPAFDESTSSAFEPGQCAVALEDFDATKSFHLPLRQGDIVVLLLPKPRGDGWARGYSHGRSGYFPLSCVSPTQDTPTNDADLKMLRSQQNMQALYEDMQRYPADDMKENRAWKVVEHTEGHAAAAGHSLYAPQSYGYDQSYQYGAAEHASQRYSFESPGQPYGSSGGDGWRFNVASDTPKGDVERPVRPVMNPKNF